MNDARATSPAATLLAALTDGWAATGDVRRAAPAFLTHHGLPHTAAHVAAVAAEARRLALRFGLDADAAEMAGWLHDISAPIPNSERVAAAYAFGVDVLPEEIALPMIVHQRLSAMLARDLFGVRDAATCAAIGCHTTLKPGATPLDTAVFVADKIAWDQPGVPPYLPALTAALDASLDAASFVYLDYLWQRRQSLGVVHPWFRAAHAERCRARRP